jgi:hypothetical protein
MQRHSQELDNRFRTMMTIWVVLLLSQFMFVGAVLALKGHAFTIDTGQPPLGDEPIIPIVFGILAISNLGLSFFFRKRSLEQAIAEQKPGHVQTGLIIACALCESISILGVVLAVAFGYQYYFIWLALGIIGIFLHFPRRKHLLDASFSRSTGAQ